jgi:hypothetical protein
VSWAAEDKLSGVDSCAGRKTYAGPDRATGRFEGTCFDVAGNESAVASYPFQYDETPPTVAYSGGALTYGVLDNVEIICTADDNLSGIQSDTCADVIGPAWSLDVGEIQFSAEVVDVAGNESTQSISFELMVTNSDLASLTETFLKKSQRANSLAVKLTQAADAQAAGQDSTSENLIGVYINELNAQRGKALTSDQVDTLIRLTTGL